MDDLTIEQLQELVKKQQKIILKQQIMIKKLKSLNLVETLVGKLGEQNGKKIEVVNDTITFKKLYETRQIDGVEYYISLLDGTDTQFIYEILNEHKFRTLKSVGQIIGWLEHNIPNFN